MDERLVPAASAQIASGPPWAFPTSSAYIGATLEYQTPAAQERHPHTSRGHT
jgi:hypothetical protein